MSFTREPFDPGGTAPDSALLSARLRSGRWLVETGHVPPPAHRPDLLLGARARAGGIALSLCSATLLALDLGPALIGWLAAARCAVDPLAGLALHEILLNAAVHGNLDVGSGPSTNWGELAMRESLIASALRNPVRAARVVTVALGWDAELVWTAIADQGAGYQPAVCPPMADGQRRGAGRGLLIARTAGRVDVRDGGRCTQLVFDRVNAVAV